MQGYNLSAPAAAVGQRGGREVSGVRAYVRAASTTSLTPPLLSLVVYAALGVPCLSVVEGNKYLRLRWRSGGCSQVTVI